MDEIHENGRGGTNAELWRERFQAWKASGLSMRSFCLRENIGINGLRYWRGKLEGGQGRNSLVRVSVKAAELVPTMELVIRGRFTVRVPVGFRAEELAKLVEVLESLA